MPAMPKLPRYCLLFVLLGCPFLSAPAAPNIPPGEVTAFTVPLTPLQRRFIGGDHLANTDRALCVVAVPPGFDPARSWPVLIVSATSDPGYNSSRLWLKERYAETALAAGWVVIAADPPTPQPPMVDSPELRYTLAVAALEELERHWPSMRDWPLAFGGFSGGAKHSVFLAALFAKAGRPGTGLFLGGCNLDVSDDALNRFSPPRRVFQQTPVFISGGNSDDIATPVEQARVEASMRGNGFTRIRRESHAGGHVFHAPHLAEALKWIDSVRAGPPTSKPARK
jgi:hypothetical protein